MHDRNHGPVGPAKRHEGTTQPERGEPRTGRATCKASEPYPGLAVATFQAHRSVDRPGRCVSRVRPHRPAWSVLVCVVLDGVVVRAAKRAIALALAEAVKDLVPAEQVYAVEKATLPTLPAVEVVAVTSERQETGPLLRHQLSVEITVSDPTEDGADESLNAIVAAVRARLSAAENEGDPIVLPDGSLALVELGGTRWSISAGGPSSVIRGAAVAVAIEVDE